MLFEKLIRNGNRNRSFFATAACFFGVAGIGLASYHVKKTDQANARLYANMRQNGKELPAPRTRGGLGY